MRQQVIWNPRKSTTYRRNPAQKAVHKGPDLFGVHHEDFSSKKPSAKKTTESGVATTARSTLAKDIKRFRHSTGNLIALERHRAQKKQKAKDEKRDKYAKYMMLREEGLTAAQAQAKMSGKKVSTKAKTKTKKASSSKPKTVKRTRKAAKKATTTVKKTIATGGKKMAKSKRKAASGKSKISFKKAATQRLSPKKKGGYAKIHKGERFKVATSGKGFLVYQRNPIALGGYWDTGMDGKQLALVLGAGIIAPIGLAILSRVSLFSKITSIPNYGVPAVFMLAGGLMNALAREHPTIRILGQAFVVIGAARLGGALADQFSRSSGGIKGLMDGLLGESDSDVGEYGEEIAALPAGYGEDMSGVDFTPTQSARPQPLHGDHLAALPAGMSGVDFTRTNQRVPGRDGVNFGAMRDGVDFGGEYGEYAGSMG